VTRDVTSAYRIEGAARQGQWVVTVDHAANTVPEDVNGGTLGLSEADMGRHIAFDPGALGVARALARGLGAPMIAATFSRLVIDPNRGEGDPTLLMQLCDGLIIPGNRHADAAEVDRRLALYHRPYHRAVAQLLAAREAPVVIAIHSFTRQLQGHAPRPWHVGVLYAGDARLARPLIARLNDEPGLCVGDNAPYAGHLPGSSMDRHGGVPRRLHALIEVRNDLIRTRAEQEVWGRRLAPILEAALRVARTQGASHTKLGGLDDETRTALEAAAFRRLLQHLDARKDVQNIDMMNLTGFCRNCLSRWYGEAAAARGIRMDKEAARQAVYGMPYAKWKEAHQTEATEAQKAAFAKSAPDAP